MRESIYSCAKNRTTVLANELRTWPVFSRDLYLDREGKTERSDILALAQTCIVF